MSEALAKLALLVYLLVAATGCRGVSAPAPYLFLDHLDNAEVTFEDARTNASEWKLFEVFTFRSETRRALAAPFAARVSFEIRVPPNAALRFAYGASTLGRPNLPTTTEFLVLVDDGDGEERVFSETLRRSGKNHWLPRDVDLSRFAGTTVRLTFATGRVEGKRPRAEQHMLPLWGNPTLVNRSGVSEKPDIVLISIDCLRADHLSAYGYARETSPHLDAFAREATLFETNITASSYTLPAHAAMLTGLPPSLHGAILGRAIAPSVPYTPESLARAGYRTAGIAAAPFLSQSYGFHRGFHTYRATGGRAALIIDQALELFEEGRGQPQFFFLHLFDLHWPYSPPAAFRTRFGERPDDITDLLHHVMMRRPPDSRNQVEHAIALYDGELAYVDEELQRFFDALRNAGLWDTALVIVTADHGEAFYEHQDWDHARPWRHETPGLYEEIVHVPLIVKWPGESIGRRIKNLVSQMDVSPTILEAAGIEPATAWATGLRRWVDTDDAGAGAGEQTRNTITEIVSFHRDRGAGLQIAFRDQDTKYVATFRADRVAELHGTAPVREELYDLRNDPGEQDNLIDDDDVTARPFRAALRSYLKSARELAPTADGDVVPDEKLLEELRSLGYVEH